MAISPQFNSQFYFEVRENDPDGQMAANCGVHAANAFIGKHTVSDRGLASYVTDNIEQFGKGFFKENYNPRNDGCEPESLKSYLVHLANENKIDTNFSKLVVRNIDLDKLNACRADKVDRIIIQLNGHFITMRKDDKEGWHILDDAVKIRQDESFEYPGAGIRKLLLGPEKFSASATPNRNIRISVIAEEKFFPRNILSTSA